MNLAVALFLTGCALGIVFAFACLVNYLGGKAVDGISAAHWSPECLHFSTVPASVETVETVRRGRCIVRTAGFRGVTMANGERFDPAQFTAASNYYPLGAWLGVTALQSGQMVMVKVTDNFRNVPPAIGQATLIALSSRAFDMIDALGDAVALEVEVTVIPTESVKS